MHIAYAIERFEHFRLAADDVESLAAVLFDEILSLAVDSCTKTKSDVKLILKFGLGNVADVSFDYLVDIATELLELFESVENVYKAAFEINCIPILKRPNSIKFGEIMMSEEKAVVKLPMHLVCLDSVGCRVSEKAAQLLYRRMTGTDVLTVNYLNETIWVTEKEAKILGLDEVAYPACKTLMSEKYKLQSIFSGRL